MAIYGQSEGSLIKGTVTLTADDATVTGSGTSFLTELTTGSELIFNQRAMIVKSIASATSLELTANWTAAGDQAIGFALEDGTLDTPETSTADNESAETGGSLMIDHYVQSGITIEGDKFLNETQTSIAGVEVITRELPKHLTEEERKNLWNKAQTTGEIINRSGTPFNSATDKDLALSDAQNRLITGVCQM